MSRVPTIGRLALLNLAGAGVALASTVLIALLFGTRREIEIYFAAIGLHTSLLSIAQTGQVTEVLLPAYHRTHQLGGKLAAQRAFSLQANRILMILLPLAVAAWVFAPALSAMRVPGFTPEEVSLAARIFRWTLPLLLIQVGAELFKTLANAEKQYGTPELVTVAARLCSVVAMIVLHDRTGIWALVAALWIAAWVELGGILWLLRRNAYRYRLFVTQSAAIAHEPIFRRIAATSPYVILTQVFQFSLDAGTLHAPARQLRGVSLRHADLLQDTGHFPSADHRALLYGRLGSGCPNPRAPANPSCRSSTRRST